MTEFHCHLAADRHLPQILALQRANVEDNLSNEEIRDQGFVTVRHDLPLLTDMNDAAAHVVATHDDQVVGYALVMLRAFRDRIAVLGPMFDIFDAIGLSEDPEDARDFFVMGQICVARGFRGAGVFDAMYHAMREHYSADYRLVVTEVATRNTRSMRAHQRVGFEIIHRYESGGEDWAVVAWDWR